MNKLRLFNDEWYFTRQPVKSTLTTIRDASISWQPVCLPHDWLIYDTLNLYESGDGWYRRFLKVTESDTNSCSALRFDGVYMNSTVYINGNIAGTWKYGYSSFEFDISDYLIIGTNEILVQVIHEAPNSRWYSGAGIYRNVWLKSYPLLHLASDGIYISTIQKDSFWHTEVITEIAGSLTDNDSLNLRQIISDENGIMITHTETSLSNRIDSNGIQKVRNILAVQTPKLWDLNTPVLYTLTTQLIFNQQVLEEEINTFGFRNISFDSQLGFSLNGKKVKLHGACQHHDLGCLGAAINKSAIKRQLLLLKEMGVNAIRTAHNMPAVELMELADELGILIVSEAFDMWERKKTTYDYARFFPDWAPLDVANWVRRDRNHPCLIMWSIGNEIYDTHADIRGQELTEWLCDLVLEHDPAGNAAITIGSNYMPWKNARKCADIVKLAGYNYAEKYYDKHHEEHPDWIIYGSETSSTVQSRGIYHFPLSSPVLADDDEQCSSLGNSSTSWGAKSTERCIIDDRDAVYSPGQFIWSGFDYIGEPTPYHTKNSYFGQIDTAGFKKDSFYIYQAEWTSYQEAPMVHIFPYWDFSEGQLIDIRVCSNAPKIELFFNDSSLGSYIIDHAQGTKLVGEWQLPYTKGTLRAVAYNENGVIIAEDIKSSFSDAIALVLNTDRTELLANGSELIFVEISAVDIYNKAVENANNRVYITVDGPGCLIGLDNGDSTDYDQYKGTSRRMFAGKLLAVISATFETGEITIKAESQGLVSASFLLKAVPTPIITGTANPIKFPESKPKSEIPVRKLEILCPDGNKLNKDLSTVCAKALLHPFNSTYNDLRWRITNAAGIDTNLAAIEVKEGAVILTALGDGTVYLRCATKNGGSKINLFSQMEFQISGFGAATINPYDFVSAGLHTGRTENLSNGNDRGVATARDGKSIINFDRLYFGDIGSDEVTLSVFSLDSEEFPIEIWEGISGVDTATLLAVVNYQKPTIWNTYQEETYKLPKRIKGMTSISFVVYRKIHLKGFTFKKYEKAYECLCALDYTQIYGDTFTLKEHSIEEIGNNVSIVFDHMDFGENGFSKLILCGHSPLDKNTIQIHFNDNEVDVTQIIDFEYSKNYVEREFEVDKIIGLQKVTFVFLPGCQFNFQWFKFCK